MGVLAVAEVLGVLAGVHQPAGPGGDVDDERDEHEVGERREAVGDQRLRAGPGDAEGPAGAGAPGDDEDPEGRQRVDRLPLAAARPAPSRCRRRAATGGTAGPGPGPSRSRICPGTRLAIRARYQSRSSTRACTAQSRKKATKMSSRASRDSTNCQAVEADQDARDAAEQGRAGEAPYEPDHHQDQQRPDDGRYDAPAERGEAERLLAQPDQPLADLGVDHHRGVGLPQAGGLPGQDVLVGDAAVVVEVVAGVAEVPQRPGVLGVVRLVELEGVGGAELPQPQEEPDAG